VAQVKQTYFSVERWDKKSLLVHLLKKEKAAADAGLLPDKADGGRLSDYLSRKGVEAHAIHGDMYQGKRNRVMTRLRSGEVKVLVASDLAARGLDVDDISHVINYDLPEDPEVYVHRIGRTARTGRKGVAWSFVTPDEGGLLTAVEMLTNVQIEQLDCDDFEPGPVPQAIMDQRERDAQRGEAMRQDRARTVAAPPVGKKATDDKAFPGGVVPKELPAKRMGGRLRSRRR
jgi:superfamily II DNA/RNA helicase